MNERQMKRFEALTREDWQSDMEKRIAYFLMDMAYS